MNQQRHQTGFTIVELMVVIAIVAVLSLLAVNIASHMRSMAHKAHCASNLRQLGLAVNLYLADHDNIYFPYVEHTDEGTLWYFGMESATAGPEGERDLDRSAGPLFPYIQAVKTIETCPAFNYDNALYKPKFKGASWGYGYNWKLGGGWTGQHPMRASQLSSASQVIVFADCAQANTFQAPASPDNPMLEEFYIVNENFKTIHFRHRHDANFLFADGHVESHKMLDGTGDERLEGEELGRITPVGSHDLLE